MKSKAPLIIAILLLIITSCNPSPQYYIDQDIQEVKNVLEIQNKAWNEGDIEAFLQGYWQSEDLRFCGSNGTQYGWETLLNMYKKSFPNRDDMGKLTFEVDSAFTVRYPQITIDGRWTIERYDTVGGHFVLLFEKNQAGDWKIMEDHTW